MELIIMQKVWIQWKIVCRQNIYEWIYNGISMDLQWKQYEFTMEKVWIYNGNSIDFSWKQYGFTMEI